MYLLRQVCGALAEAHAAGLVHRDLKPGNVIVAALGGQRDVAKLLDFGLVQDLSAADGDDRLTRTGAVLGTPAYMSPEQAAGERGGRPRATCTASGRSAFFALTGRPPFEGKTARQVLAAPPDRAAVAARCRRTCRPTSRRWSPGAWRRTRPTGSRRPRTWTGPWPRCGCAADWSAERAATWWADGIMGGANPAAVLTRTVG